MASLFNRFPDYDITYEKVMVDGHTYEACMVKDHTNVEGIIRHSINVYASNYWANRPHYVYTNYIKRKGGDWEKITNQELGAMVGRLNPINCGLLEILFAFEDEIVKKEFLLEKEKKKLKELKKSCEEQERVIEELKKQGNNS